MSDSLLFFRFRFSRKGNDFITTHYSFKAHDFWEAQDLCYDVNPHLVYWHLDEVLTVYPDGRRKIYSRCLDCSLNSLVRSGSVCGCKLFN